MSRQPGSAQPGGQGEHERGEQQGVDHGVQQVVVRVSAGLADDGGDDVHDDAIPEQRPASEHGEQVGERRQCDRCQQHRVRGQLECAEPVVGGRRRAALLGPFLGRLSSHFPSAHA